MHKRVIVLVLCICMTLKMFSNQFMCVFLLSHSRWSRNIRQPSTTLFKQVKIKRRLEGPLVFKAPTIVRETSRTSYKMFILVLFSLELTASVHTLHAEELWKIPFLFYIDFRYWKEFMVRSGFIFCIRGLCGWEIGLEKCQWRNRFYDHWSFEYMVKRVYKPFFSTIELDSVRSDCLLK